MYKVSVIIPTIGRASVFNAVQSVFDQVSSTVNSFEILLIDDSPNQNLSIEGTICIKTGGNKGVSFSRNLGIEKSNHSILAFLDDDDVWLSHHLDLILRFKSENNLDMALASAYLPKYKLIRPAKPLTLETNPFKLLYGKPHLLYSPGYMPTSGYVVDKNILGDFRFDANLVDRENLDFLNKIFVSGGKIAQMEIATVIVNFNPWSSLKRANLESEIGWLNFLRKIDKRFANNFKIESSRNFFRRKSFLNALLILLK